MTFSKIIAHYDWEETRKAIYSKNATDVENALKSSRPTLDDYMALISPAAAPYLEKMARMSHNLSQKRFGKNIQLYMPLYLSNECSNHCIYCGFNKENKIDRITLNPSEIEKEIEVIKGMGYEHLLLVTGEQGKRTGVEYLKEAFKVCRNHFSLLSLEVQPMEQDEYEQLAQEGLHTVYIYQETYNKDNYKEYHPKGKKSDYTYRLETPDRLGKAGVHKVGLGALIGLEDWRTELFFIALHLRYLQKTYWKTKYSISFPRLRPHTGGFEPNFPMNDRELLQAISAFRIFDEDVEISLSTRESPRFRDNMVKLGVTSMSAGSKTNPGGYATHTEALEQFSVHDDRSPKQIMSMIKEQGYEAVWKDWDSYLQ